MALDFSERFARDKRSRRNIFMRGADNRLLNAGHKQIPERKIALVGTADSGVYAPFDDESWEIWGVAAKAGYITRVDRWYEIHRLEGESKEWIDHWRRQASTLDENTHLYMHYPISGFGETIYAYPVDEIVDRFGTYFMTSSFAWMMAHAIHELCPPEQDWIPGEIAIYGVDMESGPEYRQQRSGFQHFIGLAKCLNINITRLASSGIAYEPTPYPMWQDDPLLNKLDKRQKVSKNFLLHLDKCKTKTLLLIAQNQAVIASLKQFSPQEHKEIERVENELHELESNLRIIEDDLILWGGIEDEQQYFRDYLTA